MARHSSDCAIPDWGMPVDQWQEHCDHQAGAASELQNAFAVSQMQFDNGRGRVSALVAQGFHVVVMTGPAYCPRTDALLGTKYAVVSYHLIRRVAQFHCDKARRVDEDDEAEYAVYPLPPAPAEASLADEDLPF